MIETCNRDRLDYGRVDYYFKFEWSDATIQTIAWKCLQLAIQRLNRDVVLAKICNDLLPTNRCSTMQV